MSWLNIVNTSKCSLAGKLTQDSLEMAIDRMEKMSAHLQLNSIKDGSAGLKGKKVSWSDCCKEPLLMKIKYLLEMLPCDIFHQCGGTLKNNVNVIVVIISLPINSPALEINWLANPFSRLWLAGGYLRRRHLLQHMPWWRVPKQQRHPTLWLLQPGSASRLLRHTVRTRRPVAMFLVPA